MKEHDEKTREPPIGMCRYCVKAVYYGDNYAICAGKEHNGMTVKRNTRRCKCKDYEVCTNDVFSPDYMPNGEFHEYTPRERRKQDGYEQLTLFENLPDCKSF